MPDDLPIDDLTPDERHFADQDEEPDAAPDMVAITQWLVEQRGFSVIPLDHPDDTWMAPPDIGKSAAVKWKEYQQRLPSMEELVEWFGNGRLRNFANVTGTISRLVVVDGDSTEGLAWMRQHLPIPPMRTQTYKGEHWYYRHPGVFIKNKTRIKTGDPAIKIDVRGDGGYIVGPGSLHYNRIRYTRLGEWPPVDDLPIFDPAWLVPDTPEASGATADTPKIVPPSIPHGQRHDTFFKEGCRLRYRGYAEAEIADTLWTLHTHRSEGPEVPRANIDAIAKDICSRYPPGQTDFVKYEQPPSKKGQIIPNHQGNIRHGVHRLGLDFRFNAFANAPIVEWQGQVQPLDDPLMHRAWLLLDEQYGFRPSLDFFHIVVHDFARRNAFHPVRDYFNGLAWDGVPRIDTWLTTYGKAVKTEYTQAVGALFLIAGVRRIRQPGCKFDTLLILESLQGGLKSLATRALCPRDDWFSDDLPLSVDAKQTIEQTAGKFLIEASELQGYSTADVEHLKSFLSRQVDGPVRMSYAREPIERPRQFLLCGTTNLMTEYLQDSTGNRRFWPVRVQVFDLAALRRDRVQLWAEAADREARGVSIELPSRLWPMAAAEQDARRQVDPWEELVEKNIENLATEHAIPVEIVWEALGEAGKYYKRNDAERIAKIMQRYGYTRKKKTHVTYRRQINGQPTSKTKFAHVWVREGKDPTAIVVDLPDVTSRADDF